jgi:DNA-binding TFAR19-related protein (PDSD5 family)
MDEDSLEDIREEKAREMREQKEEEMEAKKKQIKREIMTSDARRRLNNFQMANPEIGEKVENAIIQMHESGRIEKLDDDKMKVLLKKAKEQDTTDYDIKRR